MTTAQLVVGVWVLSAGVAAAGVLLLAARRLAEPPDHPEKVPYRRLGEPAYVVGCGMVAALGMLAAAWTLPPVVLGAWWVLSTVGVPLALVDAATTWLPLPLTRAGWAVMAVALVVAIGQGGGGWLLARASVGGAAAGLTYWLIWRLSRGGLGFGDVRLAPMIGAATAADSWSLLVAGLFLGSLAGGVYAASRLVRRLSGPFAYAPAMMIGPYAASIMQRLG
jgi:leader peptidase (prepilin peptidase)/N-methyltransferase